MRGIIIFNNQSAAQYLVMWGARHLDHRRGGWGSTAPPTDGGITPTTRSTLRGCARAPSAVGTATHLLQDKKKLDIWIRIEGHAQVTNLQQH